MAFFGGHFFFANRRGEKKWENARKKPHTERTTFEKNPGQMEKREKEKKEKKEKKKEKKEKKPMTSKDSRLKIALKNHRYLMECSPRSLFQL